MEGAACLGQGFTADFGLLGSKFARQRLKKFPVEMKQGHQGVNVEELPGYPDIANLYLPLGFPEKKMWFLPKMCCRPLAAPLSAFCAVFGRVSEEGKRKGGKGREKGEVGKEGKRRGKWGGGWGRGKGRGEGVSGTIGGSHLGRVMWMRAPSTCRDKSR